MALFTVNKVGCFGYSESCPVVQERVEAALYKINENGDLSFYLSMEEDDCHVSPSPFISFASGVWRSVVSAGGGRTS